MTFAASASLEDSLASRPHVIDGKQVECKRAMPREGMQQPLPELHVTSKKVVLAHVFREISLLCGRDLLVIVWHLVITGDTRIC